MATIIKRQSKKGSRYTATVRLRGHKSKSATFRLLEDARTWARNTETDIMRREFVDPRDMRMTLGDALKKYDEEVSVKKAGSTHGRERKSATQLKRGLGEGTYLPGITGKLVAQYRDDRLKTVSATPVRLELALLSHLYQVARKEWGYLRLDNPVKEIFRPPAQRGRIVMLSEGQCKTLLDECRTAKNPLLFHYVLLLLHSGMRPGEAAALEWPQLDLEARIITLTDTKNGTMRKVPMTMTAVEAFKALKAKSSSSGPVFSSRPMAYIKKTIEGGSSIFRECWAAARTRAKLPGLHMHDLRHTAASYMIKAGVDVRVLSEVFGWRTLQMAMRYGHVLTGQALAAIDTINGLGQGKKRRLKAEVGRRRKSKSKKRRAGRREEANTARTG